MIATQAESTRTISTNSMDLSKKEVITCPLCEKEHSQQRYQVQSWKIVQCEHCRFVYVNPRLEKNRTT